MRQFLMIGVVTSSCLMVVLGFQNCTKNNAVKVVKAKSMVSLVKK